MVQIQQEKLCKGPQEELNRGSWQAGLLPSIAMGLWDFTCSKQVHASHRASFKVGLAITTLTIAGVCLVIHPHLLFCFCWETEEGQGCTVLTHDGNQQVRLVERAHREKNSIYLVFFFAVLIMVWLFIVNG